MSSRPQGSGAGLEDPRTEPAAAPAGEQGGSTMIEIRRLAKSFGSKMALRGVDLDVLTGESVVILGPNGAGKTTLIRILSGLSKATAGTAIIGGLDLARHAEGVRRYLGVVTHAPLLYDNLTGEENLRFFARLYDLRRPAQRIVDLLEQVGLSRRRQDLVRTYSRGMVQRLAIARALLHDPPVLLLDEPDTGLDPQAAEMLHSMLVRLGGSAATIVSGAGDRISVGRTIVTVTHNLEHGLAIADRVAILVNGRIKYHAGVRGLAASDLRHLYDECCGLAQRDGRTGA